jgi:hypothetical protein
MRPLSLIAAILVVATDILYISIIRAQQGGPSDMPWIVPFVAGYLLVMAVCAGLAARLTTGRWTTGLLGAATAGCLLLGYFALMSIGLAVILAGMLSLATLVRVLRQASRAQSAADIAGALAAVVFLIAGFEVTERIIVCQPGVQSSGGGSGFLTGSYSYTCQNGKAVVTFGK